MQSDQLAICLRYTLHLARKRLKNSGMRLFIKEADTEREVLEQNFLKGIIPVIYVHETGKDLKDS